MLSAAEKIAGRRFRDDTQAALRAAIAADPPTYLVPNVLAVFRHACPNRNGRSTALMLREVYTTSGRYWVFHTRPPIVVNVGDELPAAASDAEFSLVEAGRLAFITREGRCRGCGQTARSKTGRVALAEARPPIHGRVARS